MVCVSVRKGNQLAFAGALRKLYCLVCASVRKDNPLTKACGLSFHTDKPYNNMLIAHFIDIPLFNIKYLEMQKVQMQAGAIRKFSYCIFGASVWKDNRQTLIGGLSFHTEA